MYNKHKGIAVGFDDWGPTQTSYHIQSTHIKGVLFDVVYKSPENGAAKARRKLSTVLPAEKRPSGKKRPFWPPQGDFPHKPWCLHIILAAPITTHQYFHTSPTGGNDRAWSIDEFKSRKSGVWALLLTMAAMAGWSILGSFLLVIFTLAASQLRLIIAYY
jgi:hypothetical protein